VCIKGEVEDTAGLAVAGASADPVPGDAESVAVAADASEMDSERDIIAAMAAARADALAMSADMREAWLADDVAQCEMHSLLLKVNGPVSLCTTLCPLYLRLDDDI
jgi:hypothetical protein